MKWKWCVDCPIDGYCENQDRNRECACYAREQTLRAEQYANLIDKLKRENAKLKELVSYTPEEWNTLLRTVERKKEDIQILIKKLLEAKPELEEWVKLNFGEYL